MAVLMSMGGYIFHGIDRSDAIAASQLSGLDRRVSLMEIEMAAAQAERRAQYAEIIRRLDRIENSNYHLRRRSEAP